MAFYGTSAGFITYTEARGKTVLAAWVTAVIEAALLLSSEWLDDQYNLVWTGFPTDGFTQARKWPRTAASTNRYPSHVFLNTDIPDNVVKAVYEAAFRELTEPGVLRKDFTSSKYTKVSISGAMSVEYDNSLTASNVQVQIPVIYSLMQPLLDETSQGDFSPYSGGLSRV